jgi:hypothetical protein
VAGGGVLQRRVDGRGLADSEEVLAVLVGNKITSP